MVVFAASLLYVAMLTPSRFGEYYDDSIYVTTAKALATGQGYRIISLPYEPAQILYPPLYPFLLSIIWRIYPQFPQNIFWMMLLSVLATVSFLTLVYRYLTKHLYATGWQALAVVAMAAINWRTMLLATTLLSELVYAAISIGALYVAESYEKERKGWVAGMIVGIAIGLTFLTRSSGIALLLSAGLYYSLRKQWRRSLISVGVASLFVIGWSGWCHLNRAAVGGLNADYFTSYWHVFSESFRTLQALNNTTAAATFFNVVGTNFLLLLVASPPLACFGLRYDLPPIVLLSVVLLTLIFVGTGLLRRFKTGLRLMDMYVCSYLLLHLVLPGTAYDRYLLPIVPFLLYYIVSEASAFISSAQRALSSESALRKTSAVCGALTLFVLALAVLYSNASGIYDSLASMRKRDARIVVDMQAIEWVNANTSRSDVLVCYRDPMYYFYTDRKAVISSPLILFNTGPYQERKPSPDELRAAFVRLVNESSGKYLILGSEDFRFESDQYRTIIDKLIQERPEMFIHVFGSEDGQSKIYLIKSAPRL